MNKSIFNMARSHILAENRKYESWIFTDIPPSEWPNAGSGEEVARVRVLRCREFLVQVFQETENYTRISVCRTDIMPNGRWKDGITWDELQRIKSAIGYGDKHAVEAYPPDADVVDVANIRHLWILPPEQATFFWRPKTP